MRIEILVAITAIGLVMLGTGLAVYTGRWRGWATRRRTWFAPGCGMLFAGLGLLIDAALTWALRYVTIPAPWSLYIMGIGAISFLLALMSFFWLPKFLLPAWFKALPKHEWNPK